MSNEKLTPAVSQRICTHMNNDHQEAVIAYAKHYAGCKEVCQARMMAVTPLSMELEIDGKSVEILFDHPLRDSDDAHKTLVSMLKATKASS